MITQELVDKINYLARKQKTEGLTPEEKAEQKKVREEYLSAIRKQVKQQLAGAGINEKGKKHAHHHHHDEKCSCHKCDSGEH